MPLRKAAVPRIWLTVTTPVPPMPVRQIENAPSGTRETGSGSASAVGSGTRWPPRSFCWSAGASTVANEGQSPFTQEKSWLQEDWWIWVLRP